MFNERAPVLNIHFVKDVRVNFTIVLHNWFTCFHIFFAILKVALIVSFIHKIAQPTEKCSCMSISALITFFFYEFESFKVFFCLTYFVWRLVKSLFAASAGSKPRSFFTFSQVFFFSVLLWNAEITLSTKNWYFSTVITVIPLLFPFSNLVCKNAFLWCLLETECNEMNTILSHSNVLVHSNSCNVLMLTPKNQKMLKVTMVS